MSLIHLDFKMSSLQNGDNKFLFFKVSQFVVQFNGSPRKLTQKGCVHFTMFIPQSLAQWQTHGPLEMLTKQLRDIP